MVKLTAQQRAGLAGTPEVPFLELFSDTVAAHGLKWARSEYRRCGMSDWEVDFWTLAHVRSLRKQ